ncbi:hypothetical protein [Haloferula sp. BvORR071]|uniref:hypothetical protein n=1 Tax=Haloferula sp. BvORR071 TaxID=1396141 RepID=UPI0005571664|nr:hypothetical protein [Haloferula sp. BvORR071]
MEPSEKELQQMLEAREREQAASWQGLRKQATKAILIGILALGAIAMAIPSSRELLIAFAQELPKALSEDPLQAPVAAGGGGGGTVKAEGPESSEDMLKRATAIGAHATGGQAPDARDIEFGKELLNFMTGRADVPQAPPAPAPAAPQPAAAPQQAAPKVAGTPGAKP